MFLTMCEEKNFLIPLEHHPLAVVGGQHLAREGGSLRRGVFLRKIFLTVILLERQKLQKEWFDSFCNFLQAVILSSV